MSRKDELLALAPGRIWRSDYAVTANGVVYSRLSGEWRTLKPVLHEGYGRVSIRVGHGLFKPIKVARIVCEAFHGLRPFDGALVRHLDGNRSNDAASNLAWGTVADNAQDAVQHGTHTGADNGRKSIPKRSGDKCHHAKLTWQQVREMRQRRANGEHIAALAKDYSVDPSRVSCICSGKTWKEPGAVITLGQRAAMRTYAGKPLAQGVK